MTAAAAKEQAPEVSSWFRNPDPGTQTQDTVADRTGSAVSSTTRAAMPSPFAYDDLVRLVLVGDSSVGKTCLLKRYKDDTFEHVSPTMGVDFRLGHELVDGLCVKLHCRDTAGHERFRTLNESYYRDADGIILVYDVTSEESSRNIPHWIRQIRAYGTRMARIMIVANKTDLVANSEALQKGRECAADCNADFFEASAKGGSGVREIFRNLTARIVMQDDRKKTCSNSKSCSMEKNKQKGKRKEKHRPFRRALECVRWW